MRLFLLLSILFFSTPFLQGQISGDTLHGKTLPSLFSPTTDSPRVIYAKPPAEQHDVAYFLNGQLVPGHSLQTIDPDQIEELKVDKKELEVEGQSYRASISVQLKEEANYRFISLEALVEEYLELERDDYVFLLDGKPLQYLPEVYHVNVEHLLKIEVTKIPQANNSDTLNIIALYTKSEENIKAMQQIRLKGSAEPSDSK